MQSNKRRLIAVICSIALLGMQCLPGFAYALEEPAGVPAVQLQDAGADSALFLSADPVGEATADSAGETAAGSAGEAATDESTGETAADSVTGEAADEATNDSPIDSITDDPAGETAVNPVTGKAADESADEVTNDSPINSITDDPTSETAATPDNELADAMADSAQTPNVGEQDGELQELANNSGLALQPGTYIIRPAVSKHRVLDIYHSSKVAGGNLQIHQSNMTGAQRFSVTKSGDYYVFTNLNSGKVLDVARSGTAKGTNVWQYNSNNTAAQKWSLRYNSSGTYAGSYVVESALAKNLVLDIAASVNQNGTNVHVWQANGSAAQAFYFIPVSNTPAVTSNVAVGNGIYTIANSLSPARVLDVPQSSTKQGTQLHIYNANNTQAQDFYISLAQNGLYTIKSMASGHVLAAKDGNLVPTTAFVQTAYNAKMLAHLWAFKDVGNGKVAIINAASGLALDIPQSNPNARTLLQLYTPNNTAAQAYKLKPKAIPADLSVGVYGIAPISQPAKRIDIASSSKASGANAQIHASNNTLAQKFYSKLNSDGSYSFYGLVSGLYLTEKNGDVIQQGTQGEPQSNWQKWRATTIAGGVVLQNLASGNLMAVSGTDLRTAVHSTSTAIGDAPLEAVFAFIPVNAVENGYYTVTTALGSRVLDVESSSMDNGANVRLWNANNTAAQIFSVAIQPDGTTLVINANSGKALDIADGSFASGANVQQYTANNANSQKWRITPTGDGYFNFTSNLGNNLGVEGNADVLGANIAAFTPANVQPQKFLLTQTSYVQNKLNGIDVSGWQPANIGWNVDYDFMIVKATGGVSFTSNNLKAQADAALARGKQLGLYHYANDDFKDSSAIAEAAYFVSQIKPYLGKAALFLDYESELPGVDRTWVAAFCNEVKRLTGYPCHIYCSGSWAQNYINNLWTELGVKLWQANYWNSTPKPCYGYKPDIKPMMNCTIYQYTSSGILPGYSNYLDLDVFYGTAADWRALYKKG